MILDSSPLIAILASEPDAELYIQAISSASHCRISAGNFIEVSIVLESQFPPEVRQQCDALFRRAGIGIEPVTVEQAHIARQAFHDFGKGRHPAALNFGDCFAYALAKHTGEPLLFKGNDFKKTDIVSAL
ncbi:MAG: type II toxin-antitoxin system VapC family toxin [Bryobacterales bacterium]|nr:type II toxin-antitoxin system VapC family toxin [Bryobacteraceae bacterium]MCZ2078915.1 type II toxin-antitoxin system VapC family toxin [Bryobacterales bacterium]